MSLPADPARAIKTALADLSEELIAFRRDLHRHPELAFAEERTARLAAERRAGVMVRGRWVSSQEIDRGLAELARKYAQ